MITYTRAFEWGTYALGLGVGVAGNRGHLLDDLTLHEHSALSALAYNRSSRSGKSEREAHYEADGELHGCEVS